MCAGATLLGAVAYAALSSSGTIQYTYSHEMRRRRSAGNRAEGEDQDANACADVETNGNGNVIDNNMQTTDSEEEKED